MTKGTAEDGIYHGRTELGIGQHDEIKKKLDEERHRDYQDHMRRKESERDRRHLGSGEPAEVDRRGGGVCDIGYETSQNIAEMRKNLNEARRAEYIAHLAAQSASSQTDRQEGYNISTQTFVRQQQDESTETFNLSDTDGVKAVDDRRQKQLDYAEALREQIEEKRRAKERIRRREKEEDRKNMEMAHGSNITFNYGSYRPSESEKE